MKKLLFFTIGLLSFSQILAQEETSTLLVEEDRKNELKLNALYMVAGAIEITYERSLNNESAIGVSAAIPYVDSDLNYYFSPYYRIYFGKKPVSGFYLEGFGMLNSTDEEIIFFGGLDPVYNNKDVTDFALGVGLGGKWITKGNFVGELGIGFGRNLFNSDDRNYEFVGKVGITVGYRF